MHSWSPATQMRCSSVRSLISTRTSGEANRSFISGNRLCPPAISRASSPCRSSSAIASPTLDARSYSNGAGTCIVLPLLNRVDPVGLGAAWALLLHQAWLRATRVRPTSDSSELLPGCPYRTYPNGPIGSGGPATLRIVSDVEVAVLAVDGCFDSGLSAVVDVLGTANALRQNVPAPPIEFTVTIVGL